MIRKLLMAAVFGMLSWPAVAQVENAVNKTDTISSSRIIDDMRRPEVKTQTGWLKLIKDDFIFKSVANTPDIIKTIQMLPGVTPGMEMKSDMYVRGGTGYDNLYLLDNAPVYQAGHCLGLYSVFNTDAVGTVDFYKSGFSSKYGGKTSSILDIGMKDGDLYSRRTDFSVGVTDGRFHTEGPMKEGKSSYNIGFRVGWVEAFLRPMLTRFNVDDAYFSTDVTRDGNYGFSDLNTKFTWLYGKSDKLSFNTFVSYDFMRMSRGDVSDDWNGNSRWGNAVSSLVWTHKATEKTSWTATAYLSDGVCDIYNRQVSNDSGQKTVSRDDNVSNVMETGVKMDVATKLHRHNFRYGAALSYHRYGAYRSSRESLSQDGSTLYDDADKVDIGRNAMGLSLYGEDEISVCRWFTANVGLRWQLYWATGKAYSSIEPRASVAFDISDPLTFKLSYSRMTQPDHLIYSYSFDFPGNFWMPSTKKMKPMSSNQFCAELDFRPDRVWFLTVSGFYKTLDNVSEYAGKTKLFPDQDSWETSFIQGRGKAYGVELYAEYRKGRYDLSASYTLSWSKRKFDEYVSSWFFDRFDNRNKFNLNLIYKAHELVNIYANWAFHTGNRLTLPTHYQSGSSSVVALAPNNYALPAYHRLDLGIDFKATSKKDRDYVVSFGCYNVYARKNPMYAYLESTAYNTWQIRLISILPVFPTFRYAMWF